MEFKKKNKNAKKKKEKDKDSLPFRKIVGYNLDALKMISRAAPWYIPYRMAFRIVFTVMNFLFDAWLLRYVLNAFQKGTDIKTVVAVIALVSGGYLLMCIADNAIDYFVIPKMTNNITKSIRKMMFKKAGEVELACYESPEFYDKYVKAMDEASGRVYAVLSSVEDLLRLCLSVILNGALLLLIDPYLVIFAIFPIFFGFVRKKELAVYYKYVAEQKPIDRRKRYIRRTFYMNEYAKEMRLTNMASSQIEHFKGLYGKYKVILKKHGIKRTILGFLGECSGDLISSVGSIFYAVYRTVISGTMLVGDCAVTVNSIQTLNYYLNQSVTDIAAFSEHALYIRDMTEFLHYEPKIKENENGIIAKPGVIKFENVSFSYIGSDKKALDNITFTLNPNERVALVGCNGAGKSTVVKLLLHLYEPTEGTITLDGVDIREYNLTSYRRMFATMFQDYKSFSMTVAENVAKKPLEEGDLPKVESALMLSGVREKISTFPKDMHTTLTKEFDPDGAVLSGGENQKIQLASVFFSDSPFAVLDEPSSALDPIAEYKVFEGMINATEGKSVLFISHRLSSAVLADRIVVMDGGKVSEAGSHEELLNKGGVYAEMFRRQAENYFDGQENEEGGNADD
ncbi:MAG: ABC transporter ATP-binding protein [Ruminococcaceae bacterium]|nr:ABC transporter ATP-binding protein [Oscillospiraceae bacterium]